MEVIIMGLFQGNKNNVHHGDLSDSTKAEYERWAKLAAGHHFHTDSMVFNFSTEEEFIEFEDHCKKGCEGFYNGCHCHSPECPKHSFNKLGGN